MIFFMPQDKNESTKKEELTQEAMKTTATPAAEESGRIEVLEQQVKNLTSMLEPHSRPKRVKEHFGNILFWEDVENESKLYAVLDIKKTRESRTPEGERRLVADFTLYDGKERTTKTLDYLNVLTEGIRRKVEILESKVETLERNQGSSVNPIKHIVEAADPVALKKSGRTHERFEVNLTEEYQAVQVRVKFMEGEWTGLELILPPESLNI